MDSKYQQIRRHYRMRWTVRELEVRGSMISWTGSLAQREYNPLEKPGIYLRFAKLKRTAADILKFANKYGLLTEGEPIFVSPNLEDPNDVGQWIKGEMLRLWVHEIVMMATLVELWQAVSLRWQEKLRKFVSWSEHETDKPIRIQVPLPPNYILPLLSLNKPYLKEEQSMSWDKAKWTSGDLIGPASHYLSEEVNSRLSLRMVNDIAPDGSFSFHMEPESLLSAMYMCFSFDMSASRWGFCKLRTCRELFTITHGRTAYCCDEHRKLDWYYNNPKSRGYREQAEESNG